MKKRYLKREEFVKLSVVDCVRRLNYEMDAQDLVDAT